VWSNSGGRRARIRGPGNSGLRLTLQIILKECAPCKQVARRQRSSASSAVLKMATMFSGIYVSVNTQGKAADEAKQRLRLRYPTEESMATPSSVKACGR
jgi:aminoglycoside phosphotransferase